MTVDWGVVFGLAGVAVGSLSLIYARTQAIHARRQADAAHLATTLQLQREMSDRIFQHRAALIRDPSVAKAYYEAVPHFAKLLDEGTVGIEGITLTRNAIDGLQDVYFLRKRGIVEEYHWRAWATAFAVLARTPVMRIVYDAAVARDALDPEFAAYFAPLLDGHPLPDPKVK
jgi:hypothetical protein